MTKKPEEWIEEWEKMNEEFVEEYPAFILNIPTVEQTEKWLSIVSPGRQTNQGELD